MDPRGKRLAYTNKAAAFTLWRDNVWIPSLLSTVNMDLLLSPSLCAGVSRPSYTSTRRWAARGCPGSLSYSSTIYRSHHLRMFPSRVYTSPLRLSHHISTSGDLPTPIYIRSAYHHRLRFKRLSRSPATIPGLRWRFVPLQWLFNPRIGSIPYSRFEQASGIAVTLSNHIRTSHRCFRRCLSQFWNDVSLVGNPYVPNIHGWYTVVRESLRVRMEYRT